MPTYVKYLGRAVKLCVVLAVSSIIGYATTLTGTVNNPDGTGANGVLALSLSQQAALVSTGGCGGPIEVLPSYQVRIRVIAGAMQGSPSVYGNDCLLPNGTFYNVSFVDTGGNVLMQDRWLIFGASINVGTIVSVVISGTTQIAGAPGVVLTQPATTQTLVQPVGTNFNVNTLVIPTAGTFTLPNGMVCNSAGCTGALTFNGSILIGNLNIGTSVTFPGGQLCNVTNCTGVWNFASAVNFNGGLTTLAGSNTAINIGTGYITIGTISGADVNCGVFGTRAALYLRQDTSQLEVCNNGTLQRAQLQ